jgi:hypothetical protein
VRVLIGNISPARLAVGRSAILLAAAAIGATSLASGAAAAPRASANRVGRFEVRTVPLPKGVVLRSATYTPTGKVLVSYVSDPTEDRRHVNLATIDDDGRNFRPFFSGAIPERPKDNGIRFMIFPDNKRIFLGDFVLECTTSLETCNNAEVLPVTYPAEISDGDYVANRWSEMIVAPDNRHISWDTLLTGSVLVFTSELNRQGAVYIVAKPQVVSTLDPFLKDPKHPDGVLPQVVRGGEVKQFVHGGSGLSMAGGTKRDIADSVVQELATGRIDVITQTPGYDETTIFSPDERHGLVMTARFSPASDLTLLAIMPRPYSDSLNIGLNMFAYTYSVTGVRAARPGNVGPALIDIAASKMQPGYLGVNLNRDPDWVFSSPMSWHPSSTKAMWIERSRAGSRESRASRIQIVRLPDYKPALAVATRPTPDAPAFGVSDLSVVKPYAAKSQDIDVKVYGRRSGTITYHRTPQGMIEKNYSNFSDDGVNVYSGRETMQANPRGRSTYTAGVKLTGPKPGVMNLRMTFGPLGGPLPAEIIFARDAAGKPLSSGYVEYGGRRLQVSDLVP